MFLHESFRLDLISFSFCLVNRFLFFLSKDTWIKKARKQSQRASSTMAPKANISYAKSLQIQQLNLIDTHWWNINKRTTKKMTIIQSTQQQQPEICPARGTKETRTNKKTSEAYKLSTPQTWKISLRISLSGLSLAGHWGHPEPSVITNIPHISFSFRCQKFCPFWSLGPNMGMASTWPKSLVHFLFPTTLSIYVHAMYLFL